MSNPLQVCRPPSSVIIAIFSALDLIAHTYSHRRTHMVTKTTKIVSTIAKAGQRGTTFDRMGASNTSARPEVTSNTISINHHRHVANVTMAASAIGVVMGDSREKSASSVVTGTQFPSRPRAICIFNKGFGLYARPESFARPGLSNHDRWYSSNTAV